jgi:hypothetical protein
MRAQIFARVGEIEVAVGVTSLTGRGSGVVDLDWDRGGMGECCFRHCSGEAGSGKSVCVGLESNVSREGPRVVSDFSGGRNWRGAEKKREVGQDRNQDG